MLKNKMILIRIIIICVIANFFYVCDCQPPPNDVAENHTNSSRAVAYLMSFESSLKRQIVRQNMLQCPTTDMCGFTLWDETSKSAFTCCYQCSCNTPCEPWYNCCPSLVDLERESIKTSMPVETLETTCTSRGFRNRPDIGVRGKTTCPKNSSESFKNKCYSQYVWKGFYTDFRESVPVVDVLTNTTYRNKYCALCHDIPEKQLRPWEKINMDCDPSEGLETNFMSEKCNAFFDTDTLSESQKESCLVLTVTCNTTGSWHIYDATVEAICYSYLAPVKHKNSIFGNVHCAQCNGVNTLDCSEESNPVEMDHPLSFDLLFGFNRQSTPIDRSCQPNYVFDEKTGCVRVSCSPLRILVDSMCKSVIRTVERFRYKLTYRIFPLQNITLAESLPYLSEIITMSANGLYPTEYKNMVYIEGFVMYVTTPGSSGHTTDINRTVLYFDLSVRILLQERHDLDIVLNYMLSLKNRSISVNSGPQFLLILHDDKDSDLTAIVKNHGRGLSGPFKYLGCHSRVLTPDIVQLQRLSVDGVGTGTMKTMLINDDLCIPFAGIQKVSTLGVMLLRPCPIIQIHKDEFQWNETATELVFPNHNVKISISDFAYTSTEDTLMICFDTYLKFFRSGTSGFELKQNWIYCVLLLFCICKF